MSSQRALAPVLGQRIARVSQARQVPVSAATERTNAHDDKRWARRMSCAIAATIEGNGVSPPVRCTIRDKSSTGALIEFPRLARGGGVKVNELPDEFTLAITTLKTRTEVECRVMWTSDHRLGVKFAGAFRTRDVAIQQPVRVSTAARAR